MAYQKAGRRGRNCEFILKKNGTIIKSFQTMDSIARLLKVCITTILNTVNKKKKLKGFTIDCIEKTPLYVRMFNLNGKLIHKFETISDAAKLMRKMRGGNISSLESGISFAARTETSRFGYWWRRDGIKKQQPIVKPKKNIQKKSCSYWRYYEDFDTYKKCGKIFVSEGNHNHYCPLCQEYIDLTAGNVFIGSTYRAFETYEEKE